MTQALLPLQRVEKFPASFILPRDVASIRAARTLCQYADSVSPGAPILGVGTGRIASCTVTGKVNVTAGPRAGETSVNGSYQIDIPETVEFAVSRPQSVPSQLTVHSPEPWSLGRPQATHLSFAREEIKGAGERWLTSGIKSGTARFDDTAWPVLELREGDLLTMRPAQSAVLDARGAKGVIHMTVNGAVSGLRVGDSTTKTELAPSYLEYLYNKKSLAFFWSAIVFLWGLIWSVRNTIFRQ